MPQTSKEVQDIIDGWFPPDDPRTQDHRCLMLLEAKGWVEKNGMLYPPVSSYYGPREDYVMLKYLVEEWDYSYKTGTLV